MWISGGTVARQLHVSHVQRGAAMRSLPEIVRWWTTSLGNIEAPHEQGVVAVATPEGRTVFLPRRSALASHLAAESSTSLHWVSDAPKAKPDTLGFD